MNDRRLKRTLLAASVAWILSSSGVEAQQSAPGELEALKKQIQEVISQNADLKKRVRDLEEAMKARGPAESTQPAPAATQPGGAPATQADPPGPPRAVRERIQLGGALEVEAGVRKEFNRVRSSDLALTTAEFDFEADVVDWAKAELSLQWDSGADKITLNEGLITFAKPTLLPVYLKTGRGIVPFGTSTGTTVAARLEESLTLTGPLTIEAFEAKEDYVLLGARKWGFQAGAYVFNGATDNRKRGKHLEHYGATLGYEQKTDLLSFDVGVDWIDSVFDTDGLTSAFPELQARPKRAYTPGVSLHGRLGMFGFSLIAEYVGATRRVHFARLTADDEPLDVKTMPEAWQVELGYMTKLFGIRPFVAFNYSRTTDMLGAFPERRVLATVGSFITDNIRLALEYSHEDDYPIQQGGTGRSSDGWLLRLTYEW
jgi:hypothetical protein